MKCYLQVLRLLGMRVSQPRQFVTQVALIIAMFATVPVRAETPWDHAVEMEATVNPSTHTITLRWKADQWEDDYGAAVVYQIYRREVGNSWPTSPLYSGTVSILSYADSTAVPGVAYEYRVYRQVDYSAIHNKAYGYIRSGIRVSMTESRGTVLVLVDNGITGDISAGLATLKSDLLGDGWKVKLITDLGRGSTPAQVRQRIIDEKTADAAASAVYLVGHLPVAYAGNSDPDGHGARKMPSDMFYGDIDGSWGTPNSQGVFLASSQVRPAGDIELAVGRADFYNLNVTSTDLGKSESQLISAYLAKVHAFRSADATHPVRVLFGDGFGNHSPDDDYPAVGAYRSMGGLVGIDSGDFVWAPNGELPDYNASLADSERWISKITASEYLWSHASGAGGYDTESKITSMGTRDGTAKTLHSSDLYSVGGGAKGWFYQWWGSYLPDWSLPEHLSRVALAVPNYGIASIFQRPYMYLHGMGMGDTLGETVRRNQNNTASTPEYELFAHSNELKWNFYNALMGDPALRQDYFKPATGATASRGSGNVTVSWTASTDSSVMGYYVYRSSSPDGPFTTHLGSIVSGTSFVDSSPLSTETFYAVRAVKEQVTASGSYYNLAQAAFCSVAAIVVSDTVWFTDVKPAGATTYTNGDTNAWTLVTTSPTPYHGTGSRQSALAGGLHEHYFGWASATMTPVSGDKIYAYVYIDGANPPSELMLSFYENSSWEHRAYWGANTISYGTNGTASRLRIGDLPTANQWKRLEMDVDALGLAGKTINGMSFSHYDGRATWNEVGRGSGTPPPAGVETLWFADNPPSTNKTTNNDPNAWTLVTSNPAPYQGTGSRRSANTSGLHEHAFGSASTTLPLAAGDKIYAYVWIDGTNPPTEVMLSFYSNSTWEHRAYWGSNSIAYGTNGTASRFRVGDLPATGQWVRLEVNASDVGLGGATVSGMAFSLYNGSATWNAVGKIVP